MFGAGDDPFACSWEKEEISKRWSPLGKEISLELEEAIALGDDSVQVAPRTRDAASVFIRARVATELKSGKNQRIRRQRPRLVYDSIAPTADQKYGIAAMWKEAAPSQKTEHTERGRIGSTAAKKAKSPK